MHLPVCVRAGATALGSTNGERRSRFCHKCHALLLSYRHPNFISLIIISIFRFLSFPSFPPSSLSFSLFVSAS